MKTEMLKINTIKVPTKDYKNKISHCTEILLKELLKKI